MSVKVKTDELAKAVMEQLEYYTDEVASEVKKAVDEVSKDCLKEIKSKAPFVDRSGDYKKAMSIKTVYEDSYSKRNVWYVKPPHYRLTHLLENGHKKRNGVDETKKYPHIIYGEELIKRELPEKIEEIIKNAK